MNSIDIFENFQNINETQFAAVVHRENLPFWLANSRLNLHVTEQRINSRLQINVAGQTPGGYTYVTSRTIRAARIYRNH
ncbi:MAG: hypothetical protein ACKVT0_21685 [Planctomycetaceae bacterium]